jgi:hypothetical protein
VAYLREHSEVVEQIRQRALAMQEAEVIDDEAPEVPEGDEEVIEEAATSEEETPEVDVLSALVNPVTGELPPREEESSYMEL